MPVLLPKEVANDKWQEAFWSHETGSKADIQPQKAYVLWGETSSGWKQEATQAEAK